MPHKKWGIKGNWLTVAARVPPELKEELLKKHPNDGDISLLLNKLLEMYLKGRILGIRLDN